MMGSFIGYFGQEIREEMRLQLTALRDQVANDFNSTDKWAEVDLELSSSRSIMDFS